MPTSVTNLEPSDLISLAAVYMSEWTQRNNILWQHAMQLFFAAVLTMLCPHIIGLIDRSSLPFQNWLFYLLGICISVASLVIFLAAQRRIRLVGDRYRNIIKMLLPACPPPDDILFAKDSVPLCMRPFVLPINKILQWYLNKALLIVMFCSLILLGVLLIVSPL